MKMFLALQEIASQRGDGLRPELLGCWNARARARR